MSYLHQYLPLINGTRPVQLVPPLGDCLSSRGWQLLLVPRGSRRHFSLFFCCRRSTERWGTWTSFVVSPFCQLVSSSWYSFVACVNNELIWVVCQFVCQLDCNSGNPSVNQPAIHSFRIISGTQPCHRCCVVAATLRLDSRAQNPLQRSAHLQGHWQEANVPAIAPSHEGMAHWDVQNRKHIIHIIHKIKIY